MTTLDQSRYDRIFIIGPFPPPVNGAAKNTARVTEDIAAKGVKVIRLSTSTPIASSHSRSYRYHLARMVITLRNAMRLLCELRKGDRVYLVPDGGLGIWYNVVYGLVIASRPTGSVWMHHRSYPNVSRKNKALQCLVELLRRRLGHIFLEEEMKAQFIRHYGEPYLTSYVVRNAATCDVMPSNNEIRDTHAPRVGFLSNLNEEKGFDIAVEAFKLVAKDQPNAQFAVAGNPSDGRAADLLSELQESLGDRLTYHGHVGGAQKQIFFESIDIFVFPTTYHFEAQPNVLYEAAAAGAFIVSTSHACIPFMLEDAPHSLVSTGERAVMVHETSNEIILALKTLALPGERELIKRRAVDNFQAIREEAIKSYERFLSVEMSRESE